MLNSKKAAALAGVLGGLALAGTGLAHAAAADDDAPGLVCTHDAYGNVECSRHTERTWTSEDGSRVYVEQSRTCSSYSKNRQNGPLRELHGVLTQGARMDCSNSAPG